MNFNKKLLFVLLATSLSVAYAETPANFQAGDIAAGQKWALSTEIASYYKDGTSGTVKFTCDLEGSSDVKAILYPGKNFNGSPSAWLGLGMNGPYTWTLKDQGEVNGDIKIKLLRGSNATIQCVQVQ